MKYIKIIEGQVVWLYETIIRDIDKEYKIQQTVQYNKFSVLTN